MTLKFVTGRSTVKFHHKDDAMTVAWDLDASLEGDELLEQLRSIVTFMDGSRERQALPQRTPGVALEAARSAHPAQERPANGWAGMARPEIPEDRQGDWELIPEEEQG
ncbi:hypothetical protein AB0942_33365 [Streptomyces nodosus]|uniref:hypothetical protein n=1 Tax=Streptomyces nodosus TaxID=40318 RepID=UPI003455131B